ncbi:MAG: DUF4080 domain-containing protein [Turicibacter sp.]|nr:DUF4080 domain-containing protein [Turicibacter sp.]
MISGIRDVKILFVAVNARFLHTSLAGFTLMAGLGEYRRFVEFREFTVNQLEMDIVSELFELKPDVLAFSCYIWNIDIVLSVVSVLKKILPVKIIVGGPEVFAEYEGLFDCGVDVVVRGRGEIAFKNIVAALVNGETLSNVYENAVSESIFPYADSDFESFANRIIYYESQFGCANNCAYCLAPRFDQRPYFTPLDRVKSELKIFLTNKVKQVKFVDRTFNIDRTRAADIWRFLLENDNGVTNFHFELAGDLLDGDDIALLKTARKGLFQFEIGVQSTNPPTLEAIGRRTDTAKLLENARLLDGVYLDLIVGLPHESTETFIKSFNDVMAVLPYRLHLGFLKLLKGTALRENAEKYGIKYRAAAPYDILFNDSMDFAAINDLRKIEHILQMLYNSGNFDAYTLFMLQNFSTPYRFFKTFADYWYTGNFHKKAHKKFDTFAILLDFADIAGQDRRLMSELLKYDMLSRENIRTFPPFIADYYRYDRRKIDKKFAQHTFEYDIISWLENPTLPLTKKQTEITFHF